MSHLWLLHILALTATAVLSLKVVQRCKLDVDVRCPSKVNPIPGVSCSTESCMASGDSSWYVGSVYDTNDCLTKVNLMVKIDYVKGFDVVCSLVPLVSEAKLLETYSAVDTCAQAALNGHVSPAVTPAPTTPAPSTPAPTVASSTPAPTVASSTPAPTSTIAPPKTCPVGWQIFESSCFQVTSTKGSYGQGYNYCTQAGGNLASIRSEAENNFVAAIVTETTWFGLSDGFTEGQFFFADGSLLVYENWNTGEPNNFLNNENCCVILPNPSLKWNDENCEYSFPFLCRMPAQ